MTKRNCLAQHHVCMCSTMHPRLTSHVHASVESSTHKFVHENVLQAVLDDRSLDSKMDSFIVVRRRCSSSSFVVRCSSFVVVVVVVVRRHRRPSSPSSFVVGLNNVMRRYVVGGMWIWCRQPRTMSAFCCLGWMLDGCMDEFSKGQTPDTKEVQNCFAVAVVVSVQNFR